MGLVQGSRTDHISAGANGAAGQAATTFFQLMKHVELLSRTTSKTMYLTGGATWYWLIDHKRQLYLTWENSTVLVWLKGACLVLSSSSISRKVL